MTEVVEGHEGRAAGDFGPTELRRYARHLSLPSFGFAAQARLSAATVLVVGAGGLGSPVLMYLAAGGVGTIHVVDDDEVDLSNLQRQVVHGESDIGRPKVESAAARLREVNPLVVVVEHRERVTVDNASRLVGEVDLVVDCSDNFPTRYLLNDACADAGIPCVWGSVQEFDGQVAVWWAGRGPCYRCLHPVPPPDGMFASCEEAGVLGSVCAVVGGLQATEAIKVLSGVGEPLVGRMLAYDGLSGTVRAVAVSADPGCPACGDGRAIAPAASAPAHPAPADAAATGRGPLDEVPAEIESDELLALLAAGGDVTLIDCRERPGPDALPGATHVPFGRLVADPSAVPGDGAIVVYCDMGRASLVAASALRATGRPARSLRRGLASVRPMGAPTVQSEIHQRKKGITMTTPEHHEDASACHCGETNAATPELDARLIPHEVRHAAILGALDSLKPGCALILVAPHDPKPLLAQIDAKYGDGFGREYVQSGPDAWKIRFERTGVSA